eukprot:5584331-Prymnesium_polylepis.2
MTEYSESAGGFVWMTIDSVMYSGLADDDDESDYASGGGGGICVSVRGDAGGGARCGAATAATAAGESKMASGGSGAGSKHSERSGAISSRAAGEHVGSHKSTTTRSCGSKQSNQQPAKRSPRVQAADERFSLVADRGKLSGK